MTTSEERYVSLPSLIPSDSPNRGIGEILVDTEDSRNRQETKIPPHPSEFVVIYASGPHLGGCEYVIPEFCVCRACVKEMVFIFNGS